MVREPVDPEDGQCLQLADHVWSWETLVILDGVRRVQGGPQVGVPLLRRIPKPGEEVVEDRDAQWAQMPNKRAARYFPTIVKLKCNGMCKCI